MKIGVFLKDDYNPVEGGGFAFYDRLIRAIDDHVFDEELDVVFIGKSVIGSNVFQKKFIFLPSNTLMVKCLRVLNILRKVAVIFNPLFNMLERKINIQHIASLKNHGVKLLFYPIQAFNPVRNFPFISTNWDLGHLTSFPFPEFILESEFESRERWYKVEIRKALMVFSESQAGKEELHSFLSIPLNRLHVVPMFPGNLVSLNVDNQTQRDILKEYQLVGGSYFFYPAQFWAHKNHANLLLAFSKFKRATSSSNIELVLTGSDKGNLYFVRNMIDELQIPDVKILGFVDNESMYTLYKNSIALIMPSFLGPTNMPLLEAQHLGVPVLCSRHHGHIEMLKDAAIYFDPEDHEEIFNAINLILNEDYRSLLVVKSNDVFLQSEFNLENAMYNLNLGFLRSKNVRACW